MARVKRGVTSHARHKKVLKKVKGQYGARSKLIKVAKQAAIKAGQYAYRDRRKKKGQFRSLWIIRINAAARLCDISYSKLMHGLKAAEIDIDTWKKIPIFEFLTNNLDLSTKELYKTFNMGIGLVLIVEENQKGSIIKTLENDGCKEIGRIITSSSKEVYLREQ